MTPNMDKGNRVRLRPFTGANVEKNSVVCVAGAFPKLSRRHYGTRDNY